MRMTNILRSVSVAALVLGLAGAANAEEAKVGQLTDFSGATADVGVPFGQGIIDAIAWANKKGGVNVVLDTVDYGYQVPRAVAQYKKWSSPDNKVPAILGWGTADTEALTGFIAHDQIPYVSASYSAALSSTLAKI
jgi:branched-chain amino acid transport system substrate-binding protein